MTGKKSPRELPSGGGSYVRDKSGRLTRQSIPSARAETAGGEQEKAAPTRSKVKENDNG